MSRSGKPAAPDAIVVLTTAGSQDQAVRIAEALVEERLAACVNILPGLRSIYRWKGKLWDDEEILLLIKTRAAALEQVRERVRALHSYELPEILALPVTAGDADVLEWIQRGVAPGKRRRGASAGD
jgi:periplasmic divalent cation tolerance protein